MDGEKRRFAFPPPHPGEYLKEDVIPALDMSVADLAKHLGVGRAALSDLVNQRKSISLDMAIRLGQAFKNGARFWWALQNQYDLWHAEQKTTISVDPLEWSDNSAA